MAFWNAHRWIAGIVAAAALTLPATLAPAQNVPLDIPPPVISKTDRLTPEEETLVRRYVARHAPELESGDPQRVSRARAALQKPLIGTQGSVAPAPPFRLTYTTELVSHLDQLVGSGEPSKIIVALHLAGHLATGRAVQLPLQHLDHQDVGVRYAAARALGLTFQALDRSAPAVRDVPQLISELGARLRVEDEPMVLDRLIRTLGVAVNFNNPPVAGNRIPAIDEITGAVAERLRAMDPEHNNVQRLQMLLRALETVHLSFVEGVFTEPPSVARDDSIKAAGGLGGDALVYVAKRAKAGIDKAEERDLLVKIALTGETIIFFASPAHTQGRSIPPPSVANLLKNGQTQQFLEKLREIYTGPNAVLTTEPFSFDPARFDF